MRKFEKIDQLISLAEDGEAAPRWAMVSQQARDLIAFTRKLRDETTKDKDLKEFKEYAFNLMKEGTTLLSNLGYRGLARKINVQIDKYYAAPEPRIPPEQEPSEEPEEEPKKVKSGTASMKEPEAERKD